MVEGMILNQDWEASDNLVISQSVWLGVLSNSQVFLHWSNIQVDVFNVKRNKPLNWCG